jgi:hypothetical protein
MNSFMASAVPVLIMAVVSGCAPSSEQAAGNSSGSSIVPSSLNHECAESSVPVVDLDPQGVGEPVLGLPQPSGWTFTAEKNSPVIRGVVFNQGLQAQGFTPNAVVTLEDLTGRVSGTQQALDFERVGITDNVGALDTDTPATMCGFPSTTITYNLQGRPVTGLVIAAQDSSNRVWAVTVTIQTTEPDNPDYIAGKQAILGGFQFSLPG